MKQIKFWQNLVEPILSGKKTVTWRLFDDKDLQVGDKLTFIVTETGVEFARAIILAIREKKLGETTEVDFNGHEKYQSTEDMLKQYRGYYGERVTLETIVKIVSFKLL